MNAADLIALHGEEWSLVLERRERGLPVWRHLGARVDPGELPRLADLRSPATFSLESDPPMDVLPVGGMGWFGPEALRIARADGTPCAVVFDECEIEAGDNSLQVTASDSRTGIAASLDFARSAGGLAVTTSVRNAGETPLVVSHLASATFPLPASAKQIVSWRGRHNAEFVECREPMPEHGWSRETRRGLTGHGGPCGAYVLDDGAGWHSGLVVALQLAWSGDARLQIERLDESSLVCAASAALGPRGMLLEPSRTLSAPPVLLSVSPGGCNGAMAQMHEMVRRIMHWPSGEMRPRPVHLNSWEACYFSHDEARIERLARAAAELGAERFVLDDGWFKGRDHDRAGLGDWTPDPAKYPQGLRPLAEKVNAMGLEFGLWVEPEMVNPDSDLYRAHPDWVLHVEGASRPTARNQLVLDMRRAEVRDYLFDALDAVLASAPIAYLKWDHNRDYAPAGGSAQTRGTYDLLTRLRAAHPQVEIESCAGGGGRIDAGIAAHSHRFWTSDNIDALARIPIQRGFLAFMPPEVMGAHVGASPSHATGRTQALDFRAAIACQGHFGVELDPGAMPDADREKLRGWIGFYKQWRHLVHGGETRLGEAPGGMLWQAQGSADEMLLWVIQPGHSATKHAQPIVLQFAAGRDWNVRLLRHAGQSGVLTPRAAPAIGAMRECPARFTGSWLAEAGLPVPALAAESALIYHLEAIS